MKNRGMTLAQVRKLPAAIDVGLAAQALGISRSSAYAAITAGEFPVATVKVSRRTKVLTASLIAVLEGNGDHAGAA